MAIPKYGPYVICPLGELHWLTNQTRHPNYLLMLKKVSNIYLKVKVQQKPTANNEYSWVILQKELKSNGSHRKGLNEVFIIPDPLRQTSSVRLLLTSVQKYHPSDLRKHVTTITSNSFFVSQKFIKFFDLLIKRK